MAILADAAGNFAGTSDKDVTMKKFISSALLAFVLLASFVPSWAADTPVNVNTANAQMLADSLYGVGASKAEAIVQWRSANGPFTSLDQLLEVQGIGKSFLTKNEGRILLK